VAPGAKPVVRLRAEEKADTVRVWVEDNGIGIPGTSGTNLSSLQSLARPDLSGTGIGLSIVQKGLERMGGHVGVESTPGKAASFGSNCPRLEGEMTNDEAPMTKEAPTPKTKALEAPVRRAETGEYGVPLQRRDLRREEALKIFGSQNLRPSRR